MKDGDAFSMFFWALGLFFAGFLFPFLWLFAALFALAWFGLVFGGAAPSIPSRPADLSNNLRNSTKGVTPVAVSRDASAPSAVPSGQMENKGIPHFSNGSNGLLVRKRGAVSRLDVQGLMSGVAARKELMGLDLVSSNSSKFRSRHGRRCFYHFTDVRNLESIKASGGLLSMREMRRLGLRPLAPGGSIQSQHSDVKNGMDGYVHLCLLDKNPMEYKARGDGRISSSVFLQVDVGVLDLEGVLLTPGYANKAGVLPVSFDDALDSFDFDILYGAMDWDNMEHRKRRDAAWRYEVLVPDRISLDYIINQKVFTF